MRGCAHENIGRLAIVSIDEGSVVNLAVAAMASGIGMIAVALAAVWYWRWVSGAQFRWFWVGAGLWTVAVAIKVVVSVLSNPLVVGFLLKRLPFPAYLAAGGAYIGIESSLCEIGLTLLAGFWWKQLGRDAGRAVAVGVGAGAFEAFVLGLASLAGIAAWLAGAPGTEAVGDRLRAAAATSRAFWLLGPVERTTAIVCHAASRGLVLVGVQHAKGSMIAAGFLIFTLLDGVAGATMLSGKLESVSMWWFELAFSVFAFISLPALYHLWKRYAPQPGDPATSATLAPP
jgi:hypothetical protein